MKTLLILSAVVVAACAVPEGYYKQEYQFKKSSATYRDNQLETKNDDEGFYGKQGDLSGQTAPKVAQHNQHSEFISPAVDNMGHSLTTYNDRDLTDEAESAFRNHNIQPGTNRQYSHTSNQFHGQRGSSSSSSNTPTYSSHSNLGQVTQNLQYDMEKQVREALRSMHGQSQYGSQMRNEDMQYLENQLRSNITRQLQQSLQSQYGAQTTRGHSSYSSTSSGGYNPTANYDTTELNNLRQQMETALLKQLRDGARSTHSQTASSSSWNSYGSTNRGETDDLTQHGHRVIPTSSTNYRSVPYGTSNDDLQRPERLSYGQQPSSGSQTSYGSSHGQTGSRQYVTTYDRDFPTLAQSQITVNPTKRITDVMQTVQNDVTEQVRQALNTYQAKYSNPTYTLTNSRPLYQSSLDDLKRQLRYNITRHVEDELIHNYGHQDVRGEYSFSRNQRTNANYKTADLDDLKEQIENNLVNYLETSFRSYEKHNQQTRTQYTNSQRDFTQQGPQYTQSLTSDIAQNPNHVQYEPNRSWSSSSSWSSAASYGSGSGTGSTQQPLNSQLEQIRSQLQQDLNRQLHAAVYDQKSQSSHSTQSSSQVEHLLSNELKSNLTRRLQESLNEHYGNQGIRGGQSYTISTSGAYSPQANYRTEDLNQLRQQLQDSLVRNLQEQLRTSQYSTSSGDYNTGHRSQGSYGTYSGYNSGIKSGGLQKYQEFGQHQSVGSTIGEDCK